VHTGFCYRPIVLAFWLAGFTPRLDPILPVERCVDIISRARGVKRWTYRFFAMGGVFHDPLVNPGFGDTRACFTNKCIPQFHKVCANEKGYSRLSGAPVLSGPSTESRSYVASRLPNLSSGKSRACMYSTVLETRVAVVSLDLSACDTDCQQFSGTGACQA